MWTWMDSQEARTHLRRAVGDRCRATWMCQRSRAMLRTTQMSTRSRDGIQHLDASRHHQHCRRRRHHHHRRRHHLLRRSEPRGHAAIRWRLLVSWHKLRGPVGTRSCLAHPTLARRRLIGDKQAVIRTSAPTRMIVMRTWIDSQEARAHLHRAVPPMTRQFSSHFEFCASMVIPPPAILPW